MMQWSVALLLTLGCFRLSTVLSEKALVKTSTSYYYQYTKIEIERVYWRYETQRRTVAIGCVLDSGENLFFGQTYRSTYFEVRCDRINDTAVVLTPLKCIMHGRDVAKGEQINTGSFTYTCLEEKGRIGLVITGCVGDDGTVAKLGETFTRKSFLFMCVSHGDEVIHKAIACMINGQRLDMHRTVTLGKFWYKCSRYGSGGVQTEVAGCVDSTGKRIDAGEKYYDRGFLLHCKELGVGVAIVFAGCVAKEFGVTKVFNFGESWYTRPVGSLSYRMQCNGSDKRAVAEVVECIANSDQGRKALSVGACETYGDDRMFICMKHKDGAVIARLVTYERKVLGSKAFTTVDGKECPIVA